MLLLTAKSYLPPFTMLEAKRVHEKPQMSHSRALSDNGNAPETSDKQWEVVWSLEV